MEPYYTQAEQLYQVHGARGEDPTEPPASAPYPFPAVSHEPRIQQLSDDLAAAGHQPFHAPCGVMLNEGNMPYSTCVRCDDCDGFPCLVHAKSDAEVIAVRPALEHANVTLLTNAEAVAPRAPTPAGRRSPRSWSSATASGRPTRADIVVVSCGAANSAKLLLASASDKHPNGLANGSDQVGRNYMFHNSQAVLALSKEPNPTVFQKTLGLNDFYFAGEDFDYPLGQHPDGRQVAGADVPRREAAGDDARAELDARDDRRPRGRLLALDRGPAEARQPRHARPTTARVKLSLHADQREAEEAALRQAQVDARRISACTRTTCSRATPT